MLGCDPKEREGLEEEREKVEVSLPRIYIYRR
jgi:hypothetical protein